jgi:FkbM family methyltransferase
MSSIAEMSKATGGEVLMKCVGRTHLARMGRFLTNVARLDGANDIRTNGELLVQDVVLSHYPGDRELIVFDVGANVGDWSIQLLNARERGKPRNGALHAFEPVSSTMQIFRQNVSDTSGRNPGWNILPVQKALSDKPGTSFIAVIDEGCGTNSIIPDSRQAVKRTEKIELTTVDDYCQANHISEIGLLKVDAEGHDLFVLHGARRFLETKGIHVIQFEYNHRWVWSHTTLFDVFEYAKAVGYRVGKVTAHAIEFYERWDEELEKYVEGNYLFCRPDWVDRFPQIRWWKTS